MEGMTMDLPLFYGVWISGKGWLKDRSGRAFADTKKEMAEAALRMYLGERFGKIPQIAYVEFIDDAMIGLETVFLENEILAKSLHKKWSVKLWVIGIRKLLALLNQRLKAG
jgi:hypothetical protein